MKLARHILTINGGSSSIKFALFDIDQSLNQIFVGKIERIGLPNSSFQVKGLNPADNFSHAVEAPDHMTAVSVLINWFEKYGRQIVAVGHRVVHGGPNYYQPELITNEMVAEFRRFSAFDPEHLPHTILLIQAFKTQLPSTPQIACFDTAFHHNLPRVAQILPLPRRYESQGIRRYGFHGLSYEFLLEELVRLGDPAAIKGRVIMAHLGNGSSLVAIKDGKSVDTSMSFTPTSGVPMSTRSGDLDPGIFWYLSQTE